MHDTLSLRPAAPGDDAFLRSLFAVTRSAPFEAAGLDPDSVERLLDLQFEAQRRHYSHHYPQSRRWVLLEDGLAVGRLTEVAQDDHLLLLDLAVDPAARRRGLATWMIEQLLRRARATGVPLRCHVDPGNPARTLYDRLGFTVVGHDGADLLLELAGP